MRTRASSRASLSSSKSDLSPSLCVCSASLRVTEAGLPAVEKATGDDHGGSAQAPAGVLGACTRAAVSSLRRCRLAITLIEKYRVRG